MSDNGEDLNNENKCCRCHHGHSQNPLSQQSFVYDKNLVNIVKQKLTVKLFLD